MHLWTMPSHERPFWNLAIESRIYVVFPAPLPADHERLQVALCVPQILSEVDS